MRRIRSPDDRSFEIRNSSDDISRQMAVFSDCESTRRSPSMRHNSRPSIRWPSSSVVCFSFIAWPSNNRPIGQINSKRILHFFSICFRRFPNQKFKSSEWQRLFLVCLFLPSNEFTMNESMGVNAVGDTVSGSQRLHDEHPTQRLSMKSSSQQTKSTWNHHFSEKSPFDSANKWRRINLDAEATIESRPQSSFSTKKKSEKRRRWR